MDITGQVGWFIAFLIPLAYSMKYVGVKQTLWAAFTVSCLVGFWIVPVTLLRAFHQYHDFLTLRALLVPAIFSIETFINGTACWTFWKQKPSARIWAIVASLTYILMPSLTIWLGVHFSRPLSACSVIVLVLGVTGLIVFSRRAIDYDLPSGDEPSA